METNAEPAKNPDEVTEIDDDSVVVNPDDQSWWLDPENEESEEGS